ncbi:hypothetical protein SBP18_00375 [Rhodoferax ferrireducens]|uniref:hypothetical protein n=1 Tax=Rhodoferax ferrireducens TaxID=192843 RepID=UPI00298E0347|nr:hypothetical protein [Rhodoferax ferrireducens]WPC66996.1 hypothetical protein SBP18_00375 [Rhodoferax ferrireducens]
MKPSNKVRHLVLSVLVAASAVAVPAFAQVSVNINLAPPAPLYEVRPVIAPGYAWAPGYWVLMGDRHVWVRGRTIVQREGYRWAPDHWEQRNNIYVRQPGYWQRDDNYKSIKIEKQKKPKHWDKGQGQGGKHGNKGKGKRND